MMHIFIKTGYNSLSHSSETIIFSFCPQQLDQSFQMSAPRKLQLFDDEEPQHEQPKKIIMSKPKKNTPKKSETPIQQTQYSSFNEIVDLDPRICQALKSMNYSTPTKIQCKSLQFGLAGRDLLCLSETGSGKTLSFILPIINALVKNGGDRNTTEGFALILSPTRQLSLQTKDYFDRFQKFGVGGWGTTCIYGGTDPMKQVIQLSRKPAVIIATPGRILYHLQNTKGYNLDNLKYLVLDEADKLLNADFEKQFNQILSLIPTTRTTYLFSATMTSKVEKLQKLSLNNPEKIQLSQKYQTVQQLKQHYVFIPAKYKDSYLVYLLHHKRQDITIVYAKTCMTVIRLAMVLKDLKFKVTCLHGEMTQKMREANLDKFRKGERNILVSTDVSSRGIDINNVELVINYDIPIPKDYIHRVGRTARMGKDGLAITIITQYDVEEFQKIESCLDNKLTEYPVEQKEALLFKERVELSQREVSKKMRHSTKHLDEDEEEVKPIKNKGLL